MSCVVVSVKTMYTIQPVFVCTECNVKGTGGNQTIEYNHNNPQPMYVDKAPCNIPKDWTWFVDGAKCQQCTVNNMTFDDLRNAAIANRGWHRLPKVYHDRLAQLN